MPIEIKELHIKAVVQEENSSQSNAANGSASSTGSNRIDTIVAQCVEQVLAILKEKQER